MKTLTSSDRKSLIRLASTLPKGSDERRAILSGLKVESSQERKANPKFVDWLVKKTGVVWEGQPESTGLSQKA